MLDVEHHRDADLLVLDPIKVPNEAFDRCSLMAFADKGDFLFLINPLRRAKGVAQTVPGMLVPVWANTHKAAASIAILQARGLLQEGPGSLICLIVQRIDRWDPIEGRPEWSSVVMGETA